MCVILCPNVYGNAQDNNNDQMRSRNMIAFKLIARTFAITNEFLVPDTVVKGVLESTSIGLWSLMNNRK